ncbi:MAG: hypothetical protein ACK5OC_20065 [Pirellula sp.]|jgi:hypothetical protein
MQERFTLLVTFGLFALYTLLIYVAMSMTIPWGGSEIGFVLAILVSWLTLRLHPGWVCALLISTTIWRIGIRGQTWDWNFSITISLLWCAIFSLRTKYNDLRLQLGQILASSLGSEPKTDSNALFRIFSGLLTWVGCGLALALLATLMLGNNPLGGGNRQWISWVRESREVLWPGPTLLVLMLGVAIVLREWTWRRKTRVQAALLLRTESLRLQYSDLMRAVKLRRNLRAKIIVKQSHESSQGR